MESKDSVLPIDEEIIAHYDAYDESQRLTGGFGNLEYTRTRELLMRFLPDPPATVIDVGGAGGTYSFLLAGLGYQVHLVDIVPKHIEQARQTARESAVNPASMKVGDARQLDFPGNFADAILLHGPLYHLTQRLDRLQALKEAKRVLKSGGQLFGFAITRYAGLIYALTKGYVFSPDYLSMLRREIETGVRQNAPEWANTFNRAYFHQPDDLKKEIKEAGLVPDKMLGVIGPAWLVPNLDESWADEEKRKVILEVAQMVEEESILGPMIMIVGRKIE